MQRYLLLLMIAMASPLLNRPNLVLGDWDGLSRRGLPSPIRSMRDFALQEIRLPSGPRMGLPLTIAPQPFTGLLLDELDRRDPLTGGRYWGRMNITAPRQSGKTLFGSALPVLYHLFEVGETVIYGVPDLDMAADKWRIDLLPPIEKTRYRDLLPTTGAGSRGGLSLTIEFRNGARLRFMTAGGGAHGRGRVGFTSRVLVVTELNAFAASVETSEEGSKLSELEGCVAAFKNAVIYQECTVTTEDCLIWNHYVNGSHSRLVLPCPHCRQWVEMERAQLLGWQEAESEGQAAAKAGWFCPKCGQEIKENDRVGMNRKAKVLHGTQEIDDAGVIHGAMPATRTLGFRWSAFHNLFTDASILGAAEWLGKQGVDEDLSERALLQYRWCQPYVPQLTGNVRLDAKTLMELQRKAADKFAIRNIPADTKWFTIGVDLGKWQCRWVAICFRFVDGHPRLHIPDYGLIEVHSDEMDEELALLAALREWRDTMVLKGWPVLDPQRLYNRQPDAIWIDSGHLPHIVHGFCNESGNYPSGPWMACRGLGHTELLKQQYHAPSRKTNEVREIGDGYHISRVRKYQSWEALIDSDRSILWLQARLRVPQGEDGSLTLFDAGQDKEVRARHNKLLRHFVSEQMEERMEAGKGVVQEWKKHGENHFLDAGKQACRAGIRLGFSLTVQEAAVSQQVGIAPAGSWAAGARKG